MQDELLLLVTLQNHDNMLDEINERVEAADEKIKLKNYEIEVLKSGSKAAKESLTGLQMKKKQLEGDADAQEKEVKKHHSELNALKTNDAYKAMLAEIDHAKAAQVKIEDEILAVMEKIEAQEKVLKDLDSKLKTDEGRLKSELQVLQAEVTKLKGELNVKTDERETYAQTLPDPLKRHYENVRRTKGGVAIVAAVNNTCTGCRMSLPRNKTIEVKKGTHMVVCDNCSRILYIPPEEKKADASPAEPTAVPPAAIPS